MSSLRNVILVGSTGTIGTAIRKALIAHKHQFERIGVLTTPASLSDPKKKDIFSAIEKERVDVFSVDIEDKAVLVKTLKGMIYKNL